MMQNNIHADPHPHRVTRGDVEIDAMVAEYAEGLQLNADNIRLMYQDIERLKEKGVLLQIEITGVSQLARTTLWEELGVPKNDLRRVRMTAGKTRYFDKKIVNALESKSRVIRTALDRFSYDVRGFYPYRYILRGDGDAAHPELSAYWSWWQRHQTLLSEWDELVQALIDNWEEAAAQARRDYTEIAGTEAYPGYIARIDAWARSQGVEVARIDYETKEQFTERVVARAMSKFPTPQDLRSKLKVSVIPGLPVNAAEIERILLQRDQARAERDAIEIHQLNALTIQMMDDPMPFDRVMHESAAELYKEAATTLATLARNGWLAGSRRNSLLKLKPMYIVKALTRDPDIIRALGLLESALPPVTIPCTRENVDIATVTEALIELKRITRGAAEAVAQLRPDAWGDVLDEPQGEIGDDAGQGAAELLILD